MSELTSTVGVTERCYGKFFCENCKHKWSSVHAWLSYYQTCERCKSTIEVDADSLRPLERNTDNQRVFGVRKQHISQNCEKCIELRLMKYAGKCTYFKHTIERPPPRPFPAGLNRVREGVSYADASKSCAK